MSDKEFHRLLVCKTHGVMYKMRPYEGPAEYDQELREMCDRHNAQVPNPDDCRAIIFRTDAETATKLDVETALKNELQEQDVYIRDFRDELKVDALKCFNRHNRPNQGCIDWCNDDKTIGRKTGIQKEKRQYVCMYCPAAEYYTHRQRKELGLYDK
jgi:hypothetical protein